MNRRLLTSVFAMCASAAIASAQSQTPTPGATPMSAGNVTIQGCIQRSPQMSSSTPGATGTSGAMSSFVLNNATNASAASATSGATGTSGTASSSASTPIANSYRLDGDESKLTPHVGHKVEITGTVDSQAPSTSAAGATPSSAPRLKVESVKMLSANCSAQ